MKIILLFVTVLIAQVTNAETLIAIDNVQQAALGIQTEAISSTGSGWGSSYPASVVVPNKQLRVVSAPVDGLLESLLVVEGEVVKKDQVVALIKSPTLVEKQRDYLGALTRMALIEAELEREKKLKEEGIIAERRYLETRSRLQQVRTDVDQSRQMLEMAGMERLDIESLARHRRLSGSLQIRAQLGGVVLEQLATQGQRLDALEPLYKVGHLSPLWLEIHVPLERAANVNMDTMVKIQEPPVSGRVITVGRMVHGTDQGVLIRAELNQGLEQLRPGQFVQAQIADAATGMVFRVPRSALVRFAAKAWVFVSSEKGFRPTEIQIISDEPRHLLIAGPLQSGSLLAISGTAALKAAWLGGAE